MGQIGIIIDLEEARTLTKKYVYHVLIVELDAVDRVLGYFFYK